MLFRFKKPYTNFKESVALLLYVFLIESRLISKYVFGGLLPGLVLFANTRFSRIYFLPPSNNFVNVVSHFVGGVLQIEAGSNLLAITKLVSSVCNKNCIV